MASYIEKMYKEKKEKVNDKSFKEKIKDFGNKLKNRITNIKFSHIIGLVFLGGALIPLVTIGSFSFPLVLTGLSFMVLPSIPKIWRKISNGEEKKVKIVTEKRDTEQTLEDTWKEFSKSVDEIKKKYSKDGNVTKADYIIMKKMFDKLASSKVFDLIKNDEHVKFFDMYEKDYNKKLYEYVHRDSLAKEKTTSKLGDKLSMLYSKYQELSNKLSEEIDKEKKAELIKAFANYYRETFEFSKSVGKEDEFNKFIADKKIDIFLKNAVNKFIMNKDISDTDIVVDEKLEVINTKYKELLATLKAHKKSKLDILNIAKEFIKYYRESYDYYTSIGKKEEFNKFVSEHDINVNIVTDIILGNSDTLLEDNVKNVDLKIDANIRKDNNNNIFAIVYITDGDKKYAEKIKLNYRPRSDTRFSTIQQRIEKELAQRYCVNINQIRIHNSIYSEDEYDDIMDFDESLHTDSIKR